MKRRFIPAEKRESSLWTARFRRFTEWIPPARRDGMTGAWSARVSQIFHVFSNPLTGDYHPELLLYPNLKSSMEGRLSDRLLWNATIRKSMRLPSPGISSRRK